MTDATTPEVIRARAEGLRRTGWNFTRKALQQMTEELIHPDLVVAAVRTPSLRCPAPYGGMTNYWRSGVLVMCPDGDPSTVITVLPRRTPPPTSSGRRRAKSGGPGKKRPSGTKQMVEQLRSKGFQVEPTANGHLRITHPQHPELNEITSSTSSDHRGLLNMVARIKRKTGIDVTC